MMTWGLGSANTTGVQTLIQQTALRYGVPPALALAVAKQESGYNQSARGAAGEIGVFQLMPGTAAGLGVDPNDLNQNVEGGVTYLAQMLRKYGDAGKALAAYNAGPGNVDAGRIPASTKGYVASVLATANLGTNSGYVGSDVVEPPDPFYQPGGGDVAVWPETIADTGGGVDGLDMETIAVGAAIAVLGWVVLTR